MNILILGGTGAIGTPLLNILSKNAEDQIFVTSRKKRVSSGNIKYFEGNAHDFDFIDDLLSKNTFDVIIDFMVYSTAEFKLYHKIFCENAKQYIFTSSARVYANSSQEPITEETERLLDVSEDSEYLETDDYALSKARQENILINSEYKNYTIIRPYITFSETRLQLGVYEKEAWLQRALNGKKIVFSKDIAEKYTTMTYAGDVAEKISFLVNNNKALGKTFQITKNSPIKWSEVLNIYLDAIETCTGKRPAVCMLETCEPYSLEIRHYQVIYDRLYNRKFNSKKIDEFVPVKTNFEEQQNKLFNCVCEFINSKADFIDLNWVMEGALDKITNDRTPIFKIPGFKAKKKYILGKYFNYYKVKK